MKFAILMSLSVILAAGCTANPYPLLDDAELGGPQNQPQLNTNSGQSGSDGQLQTPQTRQQPPQQQQQRPPQPQAQKPTQEPINEKEESMNEANQPQKVSIPSVTTMMVKTNKGEIKIGLLPQQAPETINNYINKADSGFYNDLTFHRVEDWVVQGGDPDGNGTGGGTMPTELTQTPFVRGSVGVARGGDINVSNNAQFFFCTEDCGWLTGKYTNFGTVSEGMDVVDRIEIGDEIQSVNIE